MLENSNFRELAMPEEVSKFDQKLIKMAFERSQTESVIASAPDIIKEKKQRETFIRLQNLYNVINQNELTEKYYSGN